MAKISLKASAYRVARRKSEIARDEKWLKMSRLRTKESQELKKREPEGKAIDGSGGRDQDKNPGAEDPGSLDQGKATEPRGPEAPDNTKKRS